MLEIYAHAEAVGQRDLRSTVDLLYRDIIPNNTNIYSNIVESLVLPPLQTVPGATSEHRCVFVASKFSRQRDFKWEIRVRRTRSRQREEAFTEELGDIGWSELRGSADVNQMTEKFEKNFGEPTEKHFPLARVQKRSNESPWITHQKTMETQY